MLRGLVERAQVDKVIGELRLQALFSPEGGKERSSLGKLLKADLLVMLRAGEAPEDKDLKFLEIVICESQRGLRLASQLVPLAGNADTEIAALESALGGALAKLSEKITDVCAVPPFLSHDLDYRFDHLKAAFARVLEQHLLQRKGVLLVELAEAKALAKEAILSGDDANRERRLPLYFLGEYRNEGKGAERRLGFELQMRRGDTVLGSKKKGLVAPDEAPKQLGKMADELAEKVLAAGEAGELDPKAEIEQLVERATAFERLGNWAESLALLEAALLLNPDQSAVHRQASHVCGLVARNNYQKSIAVPEEAIHFLNHYRRGLEHMEIGLRPPENGQRIPPNIEPYAEPAPSGAMEMGTHGLHNLKNRKPPSKEREELWLQVVNEERETLLRLCRVRARAGTGDEHRFLHWAVSKLPLDEKYAVIHAMILELKDLPLARERTAYFAKGAYGLTFIPNPAFPAFLEELLRSPHADIKAAAESMKTTLAINLAKAKKTDIPKTVTTPGVAFLPVKLIDGNGDAGKPKGFGLRTCLPVGSELDFFFTTESVYLMKEKGVLKSVWESGELNASPGRACYDGRYIWFSVQRLRKVPRLLVMDPLDLKTWEFTADDGLPLVAPESLPERNTQQVIHIVPLAPGRVCLAGSFGRAWLAMAAFDPKEGKSVKVFHEARESVEAKANQWERSTLAFAPACMFVLTGDNGARRVLIGRQCREGAVEDHALLVDPETLAVTVMQDTVWLGELSQGQQRDGAVYYIGHGVPGKGPDLVKIAFPGKRTSVIKGLTGGRLLFVGDDLHLATNQREWWFGSFAKTQLAPAGAQMDGELNFMGRSNHYGALIQISQPRKHAFYQVERLGALKKLPGPPRIV